MTRFPYRGGNGHEGFTAYWLDGYYAYNDRLRMIYAVRVPPELVKDRGYLPQEGWAYATGHYLTDPRFEAYIMVNDPSLFTTRLR